MRVLCNQNQLTTLYPVRRKNNLYIRILASIHCDYKLQCILYLRVANPTKLLQYANSLLGPLTLRAYFTAGNPTIHTKLPTRQATLPMVHGPGPLYISYCLVHALFGTDLVSVLFWPGRQYCYDLVPIQKAKWH